MRKHNVPMTRDAYLTLAYGDPNVKLDAEGESMLPAQFQKPEDDTFPRRK